MMEASVFSFSTVLRFNTWQNVTNSGIDFILRKRWFSQSFKKKKKIELLDSSKFRSLHSNCESNADINNAVDSSRRSTGGRLTWLGSLETRPYDISFARWVSRADRCSGRGTHKHVLCNAAGQATPRCVAATQMPKAGEKVWRNLLNNRFYPNRRPSFPPIPWRGIPRPGY